MKSTLAAIVFGAVLLAVAVAMPENGAIVFRIALAAAVASVAAWFGWSTHKRLQPAPYARGLRAVSRPKPTLPHELERMDQDISRRASRMPLSVERKLRDVLRDQLLLKHGLRAYNQSDFEAIKAVLSPAAMTVLYTDKQLGQRTQFLKRSALAALVREVENL